MAQIWTCVNSLSLLLLLLCVRALKPIVADPDTFISFDCGTATLESRVDKNITWSSDDKFILGGYRSGNVGTWQGNWSTQLYDFRYFNESRSKFCYELPVDENKNYLLRAGFLWATFTNLSEGPIIFDVTVMSTLWTTVEIAKVADPRTELKDGVTVPLTKEIIIRSTSTVMNVCLVRKTGFPFINSLELRPLDDDMYEEVSKNKALVSQWRWTAAQCCFFTPRYPEDAYDRIWHQYDDSLQWGNAGVTKSVVIENFDSDLDFLQNQSEIVAMNGFNRPPPAVMKDAWDVNASLVMHFPIDGKSTVYYIALYFQELLSVTSGSRIFSVLLNGELLDEIKTPADGFGLISLKNISGTWANITLQKSSSSSLNPILNAAEMYGVLEVNSSTTHADDVRNLFAIRARLGLVDWAGDPCFPVPWDWLSCNDMQPSRVTQINLPSYGVGGSIPLEIGNLIELTDLWLDNNSLKGLIPTFSRLQKLKTLHLRNNSLQGSIPSELSELSELQEVSLDNNMLSGKVPQSLLALMESDDKNFTITFTGNLLCLPGNKTCEGDRTEGSSSKNSKISLRLILAIVGGSVALSGSLLILSVIICHTYYKPIAEEYTGVTLTDASSQGLHTNQARPYTYEEVKQITSNFNRVLGSGSYGQVYHGKLPDGHEVAVKVNAGNSNQGAAEFATEVVLLSRVHHKYLVSLVGYCKESSHQILIYVYMPNGSLGDHLHGKKSRIPLSWKKRLDIALNAAQGLEYLHTFCSPPIIHRDIKPNNILLDETMVARVADFGMSKSEFEGSHSGISTGVKGTMGYLDPEYCSGLQRLNVKSDVFSFGVVLLELISGQKPTAVQELDSETEVSLIERARLVLTTDDLSSFVDPAINESGYNVEAVWKVLKLGLASVEERRTDRPDMGRIVRGLIEATQIEKSISIIIGQVGSRISKSVAFALTDSKEAPLRRNSMDTVGTWDSDNSTAFNPR